MSSDDESRRRSVMRKTKKVVDIVNDESRCLVEEFVCSVSKHLGS